MARKSDIAVLVAFCIVLVAGVAAGLPTWAPILTGMALFATAALLRGKAPAQVARAAGASLWSARSVVATLALIGFLTALWRASGTVACLVSLVSPVLVPHALPLAAFAACSAVSVLTGTAFGTAATAGAVCLAAASACGASLPLCGGAALAGCYFGDRCSPISTSALLVAQLTGTRIRDNIPAMLRSCAAPALACAAAYAALGVALPAAAGTGGATDYSAFRSLGPATLLPAASVLVLALAGVGVKLNVAVSCAAAYALAVFAQGESPADVLVWMFTGCWSQAAAASGLTGGGLASMASVLAIILAASTYPGLLEAAGIDRTLEGLAGSLAARLGPLGATAAAAAGLSCVACNQTLAIMLTHQAARPLLQGRDEMLALEDTAVVMAPLVPWSIASAVPLASMGVGAGCIPLAFFLWLLPAWALARDARGRRRAGAARGR